MGLEVGTRQYTAPELAINLRSLSAKRASLIKWHKQHPCSFRLFKKADRLVDESNSKLRSYNNTINVLAQRIGNAGAMGKPPHLVASLQHVCNLKGNLESCIPSQMKERNMLANRIYEWRSELPYLDEEIANARKQPKG